MIELELPSVPQEAKDLKEEVRAFLDEELKRGTFTPRCDAWMAGYDPAFSRLLAKKGWIGMTWPRGYGGHERSAIERFFVLEELLASGAPVAAHWVADRQTGPLILKYGTEDQKKEFLPKIARAEAFFAIGMSEPDAGSDLAAIRTRALRAKGGWVLSGRKVWSSGAHVVQHMLVLCRTSPVSEDRHAGMSQFLIDMDQEGVSIRPIRLISGEHHFNEVLFENVFVSDGRVLGDVGNGWNQVMGELAFERSGPERYLSTMPLFLGLLEAFKAQGDGPWVSEVGRLCANLLTLRKMALSIAWMLEQGKNPALEAAMVKDMGTRFERDVIELGRNFLWDIKESMDGPLGALYKEALLHAPGFTLRGGTTEILRGIIARGLGVR